ncbi:UBP1-associated protein 2B-like [Macadamia integrifolia]|uniref:UBP1-associated protein 2B-like n=1 Tax=Macadamia integrifolia TaxID=60698 RepID=UPI001C529EB0|nr:UBP1-associated protein 2B-like [Macadamia integrifolia]XP_042480666.1 UBP1-associated protein 2B-like [Macadamia integrifolia]XP_042480667.1 UBP1-associated protein 2B-like [Macadamia integrifolia]XP_042480669.1 UBP1-associated protein 2B-like [Macadamia integrifolia]
MLRNTGKTVGALTSLDLDRKTLKPIICRERGREITSSYSPMARKRKVTYKVEQSSSDDDEKLKIYESEDQSSEEEEEEEEEEGEEEEEEEEEDEDEDEDEDEEEEEEEEDEQEEEEEKDEDEDDEEEEEKDEASKRELIRKLLEPFGKDQLIEILKEAALKDRSVISNISKAAESDPVHRKIFVHGLGWDSTSENLVSAFKQYGQIEECNVVTDKVTGKSKGYGFVLFKTRKGARKALQQPQKKIGNRMTACQLASSGPVTSNPAPDATGRKIYVANVGPYINPEKLRAFFAKFGEIEEGPLGYERNTGKLKGFAIFVYKTQEGSRKALEEPTKMFEGCTLQCQRAAEGVKANKSQPVVAGGSVAFPPNDLALNYAMGLNPGMMYQSFNPAAMVGQNPGMGMLNPAMSASLNQGGVTSSVGSGLSPSVNRSGTPTVGLSAAYGGHSSINSFSPSVIGSYGSQAALHGLGAYQSAQMGQSSAGASPATRSQPGLGLIGTMPSYFGR